MKDRVEILAPAGSMECLKAAIAAGADAVYTGGALFGARAYAHNLTEEELLEAIDYVHLHGRRLYLTVNTLIKDREMEKQMYDYLLPYYRQGLDAVIVQDIGLFRFIRKHLPIHASTQMTLTGVDGAKFLEKEGAQRIVTSRELSMAEVKKIADETELEIESFVHGALCYCYSGQCLFSSFIGGRSGNRGQCAQPCRLPYQIDGKKPADLMSLKDLCTIGILPEMIESGIYSFKIEGRMKKPEYVAAVAFQYRKYADLYLKYYEECPAEEDPAAYAMKKYRVREEDRQMLLDGGFHTGYYHTQNGREMISLNRPNHAGVPAVKVLAKKGRNVTAKALTDLYPQDIIELPMRKGREKADNYTCKDAVRKGMNVQIPVFADTPFKMDEIWMRTRNSTLIDTLREEFVNGKIKERICGTFRLYPQEKATLTVKCRDAEITVAGEKAQEALNILGVNISPKTVMAELSVGQQQMVEICKALMADAKVIIMDEPTAALTQSETAALFKVIESLRKKGVSMVYISHRMEEIFELCDRITVLRDGSYIGVKNIPETNMNEIVKMMIGREIGERYPSRNVKIGKEVLKVKELTRKGTFHDVNFSVRAGEVLGVSGLMGAGRTEIMQAIFGNLSYESGTIEIDGKEVKISNPRQAMEHGIGFITEDRKTEGLMLDKSIRENISLCNLRRISKSSVISREAEKNMVAEAIKDLHIKCFGSYHECNNLSGGNQQKVVLAKWILTNPKILILDEPTRGVDIGAKKEIYSIINKLAAQGVAIIMVSSELPEVLGMSDNIMVVREGEVRGIISYEEANQERVMTLATGGTI